MAEEVKTTVELKLGDVIKDSSNLPTVLAPTDIQAIELLDDDICVSIRDDDDADAVLKTILYGMAEEQAALKNLRQKKGREDKDTSHISIKRGTLLKFMAETNLQRRALNAPTVGEFDLRGPKFKEIFKMFLEVISNTFDEVKIPYEYKEMFFHALSKNLEGWENRAEHVIKAMSPQM
jgi:hypothetical protein